MPEKNLIPPAIREEFTRLVQAGRGSEAKRQAARRLVYSRMVGRQGVKWWNQNNEALKTEMTGIESEVLCSKNL